MEKKKNYQELKNKIKKKLRRGAFRHYHVWKRFYSIIASLMANSDYSGLWTEQWEAEMNRRSRPISALQRRGRVRVLWIRRQLILLRTTRCLWQAISRLMNGINSLLRSPRLVTPLLAIYVGFSGRSGQQLGGDERRSVFCLCLFRDRINLALKNSFPWNDFIMGLNSGLPCRRFIGKAASGRRNFRNSLPLPLPYLHPRRWYLGILYTYRC